jgi:hypothetical protein
MHEPELNLLFFALVFGPSINTDGQWRPSCHRTFNCVLETFRESSILDSSGASASKTGVTTEQPARRLDLLMWKIGLSL